VKYICLRYFDQPRGQDQTVLVGFRMCDVVLDRACVHIRIMCSPTPFTKRGSSSRRWADRCYYYVIIQYSGSLTKAGPKKKTDVY